MRLAEKQVELRPTMRRDLPEVVQILRSTVDWYRPFTAPEDLEASHNVDLDWAKENFAQREFISATDGESVVGVLTIQDAGSHLYLGYVYVHHDHVGRRIGRKLLDHAAQTARERGKQGLVLLSHPQATWAVKAYRKYGFSCIADTDETVCSWNDGWLRDYHEVGFHLWEFALGDEDDVMWM